MPENAQEMSLSQAAGLYDVSLAHLGRKVRTGEVEARKVRSHRGLEWRVTSEALQGAGHSLRTAESSQALPDEQLGDTLSLTAAVARYRVTKSQLVRMLTSGELLGVKVSGGNASRWRVNAEDVEAAGFLPRKSEAPTPQVIDLSAAEKADDIHVEQPTSHNSVADLDGRLGHALLTAGALRRQLRDAGLTPILFGEPLVEDDL